MDSWQHKVGLPAPGTPAPQSGPGAETSRDALHALGAIYLRHREAPRALTLLLLALHIASPTRGLLLATAQGFLDVEEPEQALAALDRVARDFGDSRASLTLRARCTLRLEGLEAARAVLRRALDYPMAA